MSTVTASMFHVQCIILSETFCGKNAEAAENWYIFQLLSVFQRSVTPSGVQRGAHKSLQSKPEPSAAGVCNFRIVAYIVLAVPSI
jgi:hypothetical protein